MAKSPKPNSSRKPPEPADDHADIDELIRRAMPDLNPLLKRVDELIRDTHSDLQFAVKWKKAYYGLPDLGWIIELVAYDVSVNVVFLAGSEFSSPPPMGNGRSRYVKLKELSEVESPEMKSWIEQAGTMPGWR